MNVEEYAKKTLRLKFVANKTFTRYANSKANKVWRFYGDIHEVPILIARQILSDHPEKFEVAKDDEQVQKPKGVKSEINPFPVPATLSEEDIVGAKELIKMLGTEDAIESQLDSLKLSDLPNEGLKKFDSLSSNDERVGKEKQERDPQIESTEVELELDENESAVLETVSQNENIKISQIAEHLGASNWREVEPHVKSLLAHGLIEKDENNQYSLSS